MLSRTLEPEVMDRLEEAVDYDTMDHSEVNRWFADEFLAACQNPPAPISNPQYQSLLDVGTGTARIPIDICRRSERVRIVGVDLSAHMLQLGQRNVIQAGLARQIRLEQADAKALPFADGEFDAVVSNSIVHHIPQPIAVVAEMVRVLRPGGLLFVRDLLRPPDAALIASILAKHAAGTNDHQRELFERSLHAALTLEEVGALLRNLELPAESVYQSSDRHWTIRLWKPEKGGV
ncbi:MAG: class I SAM-dependent methyltransferase [Planctomycetaceae bacterium]